MSKSCILILLTLLLTVNIVWAQNASIVWKLNSDQKVSEINGPLYGFDESLSNLVINRYNIATGEAEGYLQFVDIEGGHWPGEKSQNDDRYIQFAVTPKAGITFNIDSVSFYYSGFGGHVMKANVAFSLDSNFTISTQLNPQGQPLSNSDNPGDVKFYKYSLSQQVDYGQIFYLRIYPWYEGNLYTKYVLLQNMKISGTASGDVVPVLPIISTLPVYDISTTTAVSGGDITFDGEADITARGVCWNTAGSPTIDDDKTDDGTGKGKFESILTGLQKSTKYYVRAYAVNSAGIKYGAEDSLITLNELTPPVIQTESNIVVTGRSANINCIINEWGGAAITEKGVCFNTSGNPDVNDEKQIAGSGSDSFSLLLQDLTSNTKYYARAYAVNNEGIGYGEIIEFSTLAVLKGTYADGIHLDTKTIQNAIDSCSSIGGGNVILTNGVYLSGRLVLKSNVTFKVDSTATLLATSNKYEYYPDGFDTTGGKLPSSVINFITSSYADNITITGGGKIDGNGQPWWDAFRAAPTGSVDLRPRLIQLSHGKHIRIENITLKNSPKFHLVPSYCRDVFINYVTILAPGDSPNTDAIDPVTSHDVTITNCYIDVGDDNIALKSGYNDPSDPNAGCSDIYVENCTLLHGHGISIGSETNGGVDSFTVKNCTFDGTDNGIRIKSNRTRGGNVRNAVYSNITMNNVKNPILLDAYYSQSAGEDDPPQPITNKTPYFHDITLRDIEIKNCPTAGRIIGLPETPFTNINLENVNISATTGLRVRNATVNLTNSTVKVSSGSAFLLEVNGVVNNLSSVETGSVPSEMNLFQNYPNPFNPETTIKYLVPSTANVSLKVYDVLGRQVAVLVNQIQSPGSYEITFDSRSTNNSISISSGIYFYTLEIGDKRITKKMLLLK